MARRLLCFALIALLAALLFAPSTSVNACGPWFSTAIFTYSLHPDYPLTRFAGGELGVLQPTYAPSYLLAAYRYLNGGKLSAAEQTSVEKLWRARLAEANYVDPDVPDATKTWLAARAKYATTAGPERINVYRENPRKTDMVYEPNFMNCLPDAFTTAARTLDERATAWGQKSEALGVWIATQDAVFSQCAQLEKDAKPMLPPALPQNAPVLLAQDHAYQLASLQFYAIDFDAAQKAFVAIAADSASPWRTTASLLVARTLIRKATLLDDSAQAGVDLRAARTALEKIANDPADAGVRVSARGLEGFVAFRLNPGARAKELAAELAGAAPVADYGGAVGDFTSFEAKYTEVAPDVKPAAGSGEDLMDWVNTFTLPAAAPDKTNHAIARWSETHSVPWLVAALAQAPDNSPSVAALIEAAAKIEPANPAYVTVAFHRDRLLAAAGKRDEARAGVEATLGNATVPLSGSARNLFFAMRMQLATNLGDWLKFAVRTPVVTITTDAPEAWAPASEFGANAKSEFSDTGSFDKPADSVPLFDADAAVAITTKFPLAMLAKASSSEAIPPSLQKAVTQAAWTRAVIVHDSTVGLELSSRMKIYFPDRAADIDAYATAKTDEERNFAGVFAILKTPGWAPLVDSGLGRDVDGDTELSSYRQNWWCAWVRPPGVKDDEYDGNDYGSEAKIEGPLAALYPGGAVGSPEFLSATEREAAANEFAALAATGTAAKALGEAVLAFAKVHPDDARVPEALHYVVRLTRYGCYGKTKVNYSKLAFELLHARYPKSEWTKQTPYWY
jgi:hypothetical protein